MFKKILKLILIIICWLITFLLFYETISSLIESDPWGLSFLFYTLPIGITSLLLLKVSFYLTKNNWNNKNK